MEKTEFEKRFLTLVYQTNVVITAPNIAYQLSIPIEEAQEHLLTLELNGTLQQSTDPQGNAYYTMPNRPPPGTLPAAAQELGTQTAGGGSPPGTINPAQLPSVPIYSNPGAKASNINGLVLNVIFPGVGSIVCGRMVGLAMLALVMLGIVLFLLPIGFGRLLGFLPIIAGWVWSVIAGVQLLNQREPGPGVPSY